MRSLALFFFLTNAIAQQTGSVRGRVADSESAEITKATIRVMARASRVTKYSFLNSEEGNFRLARIDPGEYTAAVVATGFRETLVDFIVSPATETDLGEIHLPVLSCDAPGMNCDEISDSLAVPTVAPASLNGTIELQPACEADLDTGKVQCPPSPLRNPTSDFWLQVRSDKSVYIEPRNRTLLSQSDSAASCFGAVYLSKGIRIDGLGKGSDFCVRTSKGRISHVFIREEVSHDARRVLLYFVTDKKVGGAGQVH